MFSKRVIFFSIALTGAVALTSWYSIKSSESGIAPQPTSVIDDGIATTVHLQQYNLQGMLAYEGNAAKAVQYSDQTVGLWQIAGVYYTTPPQPSWHGSADQAHVSADGNTIELIGQVVLHRPAATNFIPLQLNTEQLFLYPPSNSAYTMAPVTLSQPGTQNITHAVGLHATETPETLDLLSKVDSTYESSTRTTRLLEPSTGSS